MTPIDTVTTGLDVLLDVAADPATKDYWERYLRGAAAFRGVPMAGIRHAVRTLWRNHDLSTWPTGELLDLAHHWFTQVASEDKLAAILVLAEQIPDRLTASDVDALAWPYAHGHVADWGVCDWYATKALHTYITSNSGEIETRARAVAAWSTAPNLWQRRASVVAFVRIAARATPPFPGFADLLLDACAANLVSADRFAHTGPGCLLREMSKTAPNRVARFVRDHPELSKEATRMATARLRPGPYRRR